MSSERRPNVLFIVVDCLREDRVRADRSATPFLSGLVSEGTSFAEQISAGSFTPPSFGSLLSGRHPFEHGMRTHGSKLAPVTLLAEVLRDAGYHTAGRFTGPLSLEMGVGRGFEDPQWRREDEYLDTSWGRTLVSDLAKFPSPWFLLLHLWELHWPRRVPLLKQRQRYGPTRYDRAVAALDARLRSLFRDIPQNSLFVLTGDHGERVDTPYDSVAALRLLTMDIGGRLWRGVWGAENVLLGEHKLRRVFRRRAGLGHVLHGASLDDELLRVPWAMRGPQVPAGRRVHGQVRHIDIAPTLLEFLGLPSSDMTGASVVAELASGRVEGRMAYSETAGAPGNDRKEWLACVRDGEFKLVCRPYAAEPDVQLFDLRNDPGERHSLGAEQPQRVQQMLASLRAMLEREIDPSPQIDDPRVTQRLAELGYIEDR